MISKRYLKEYLNYSTELIKKSSEITLKYFTKKIKYSIKENMTPVTQADMECEKFILNNIMKKFPSHNIFSEESGVYMQNSEFTWFIDPIDGTKNYMRQFLFWGTLIALEYKKEVILGIIYMPALNEMIYATKGNGCFKNGKKLRVSNVKNIKDSCIVYGSYEHFRDKQEKLGSLLNRCYYSRGYGDCHGHSFVIDGRADLMLDPHVAPYDVAPIKICVEEAGGKFTDFNGISSIYNGTAITSNKLIHRQIQKALK